MLHINIIMNDVYQIFNLTRNSTERERKLNQIGYEGKKFLSLANKPFDFILKLDHVKTDFADQWV